MTLPARTYKVTASRDGVDIGHLIVLSPDRERALIVAFWDLQEQLSLNPHDIGNLFRADRIFDTVSEVGSSVAHNE